MLSIEKCRGLIDGDEEYTDEEIEKIRTTIYGLVELAFEVWLKERQAEKSDQK